MKKRGRGGSLVELILVLGLIASIVAIVIGRQYSQREIQSLLQTKESAERTLIALGRYYWSHCQMLPPSITVEDLIKEGYLASRPVTHNDGSFDLAMTTDSLSVSIAIAQGDNMEGILGVRVISGVARFKKHPALLRGGQGNWEYRRIFEDLNCD